MARHDSHVVPPIPQNMSHSEAIAWRLWRRGLSVRAAASRAGMTANALRLLLGHAPLPSADNPQKHNEVSA